MVCSVTVLYKRQKGKCYFCGSQTHLKQPLQKKMKKRTATREHLIPKSQGGSNRQVNLRLSCHHCNKNRGTLDAILWMQIVRDPVKLRAYYRAISLRKKLAKIRRDKKREDKMLRKTGWFFKTIYVDNPTFNRLFTDQCGS